MIPGLGRSPGEGKGYPLQYYGIETSMDYTVHGVARSWTQVSYFHFQGLYRDRLKWGHCCMRAQPLFATPWTVAHQAPLSIGFPRQEYWSGLPFPSPGDLPRSGMEPVSPALAGRFYTTKPPGKPRNL